MAKAPDGDPTPMPETTGHEWDGIKELNTPLPRWWLWTFYATIVWSVGYWVVMPAWPTLDGYTRGLIGYSSRALLRDDVAGAKLVQKDLLRRIEQASLTEIVATPDLRDFALAGGKSAFAVNCSQCHGSGAAGNKGYPNLNDDDWLWGGRLEDIQFTITHGARSALDAETRMSEMPRFLTDGILTAPQVSDLADYVLFLSGRQTDTVAADRGKALFVDQCAVCHGDNAKGKLEVGAPNLTDGIWLYGGDKKTIVESISGSRRGSMPAWGGILESTTIKQLTVYVHSLGGGQ
jgi:cytochrome c oxidase cbb3-type subunit 3